MIHTMLICCEVLNLSDAETQSADSFASVCSLQLFFGTDVGTVVFGL